MRYPHIRISSYSTHCKCDICTKLQTERENIKNVQEREDCRLKIEAHPRKFREVRQAISKKTTASYFITSMFLELVWMTGIIQRALFEGLSNQEKPNLLK